MTITQTERGYEVRFQFDKRKVAAVKDIRGTYFRSKDKTWVVPLYQKTRVDDLRKTFKIMEYPEVQMPQMIGNVPQMPELEIDIPLKRPLFPYQAKGVAYGLKYKRIIVGDQMGLGKTAQAVAMAVGAQRKCILVVCPATLKENWSREFMAVAGLPSMILTDRTKVSWTTYYEVGKVKVFIVNYESLKKYFVVAGWKKPSKQWKVKDIDFKPCIDLFDCIIIDESHRCKDGTKQQSKICIGLSKNIEYRFLLTGTPVKNKPKDLASQLTILGRLHEIVSHLPQPKDEYGRLKDASGYLRFMNRYCDGGNGESNLEELGYRLRALGMFYRREKAEVLKDLPAKTRQKVRCEISNFDEYVAEENRFKAIIRQIKETIDPAIKKELRKKANILAQIARLKHISARGKMAMIQERVEDVIESGEKIILFCFLHDIIKQVKAMFPQALEIHGELKLEERQQAIDLFQNDPAYPVIICNYIAGGVGITLTASSQVDFIEFPWTHADCEQCEDRAHRIGQKDNVTVRYYLGEKTIDYFCYDIVEKKKKMSEVVTGAEDEVEEEIVDQLYNLFNQK